MVSRDVQISASIGAVIGVIGTRFMEDGNLLVSTVCVAISAGLTLTIWVLLKRFLNLAKRIRPLFPRK